MLLKSVSRGPVVAPDRSDSPGPRPVQVSVLWPVGPVHRVTGTLGFSRRFMGLVSLKLG